jgi:CBS domain-containing protein
MFYLSQLLGTPVDDLQRVRMGKIIDILTPTAQVGHHALAYPSALLVVDDEEEQPRRIPLDTVERRNGQIQLCIAGAALAQQPATSSEQEIYLAQEVLDKQVIDVERKKAVRVNDICFGDDWQILGIDQSTFALIRRIAPSWLLGAKGKSIPTAIIPWHSIELIGTERSEGPEQERTAATAPLPQVPTGHLAEMHPADIAEIVHQLTPGQGAHIIERLDIETAAATMEEIYTERQRCILENIESKRAADILQAMGPDEAADLLAQIPEERTQELLHLMNPEESEDVQELLEYEADTAGGLMTTDYIVLSQTRTVMEALAAVRSNIRENAVRSAYIYCVEDETLEECHLLGVVSLWDLLIAAPTMLLQDLMETDLVTVKPDSTAHSVAEIIAKYNLLAIPVVSEENVLAGIITVDDALDVLLPPERRRKPGRMY